MPKMGYNIMVYAWFKKQWTPKCTNQRVARLNVYTITHLLMSFLAYEQYSDFSMTAAPVCDLHFMSCQINYIGGNSSP